MTAADPAAVVAACRRIEAAMRADGRYAATSSLLVSLDSDVVYDEHYRGPQRKDVFSITKSLVATLVGMALDDSVRDLDAPLGEVLDVDGLPAANHTWRSVLTMTRGCRADGPWDVDEVTASTRDWVRFIASAPQVRPPGEVFLYDNAGVHLLTAALHALTGDVAAFAAQRLFGPLGIEDWQSRSDPDGIPCGFAHLELPPSGLHALGRLWLDHGSYGGTRLVDEHFMAAMTTRQVDGGPPEQTAYGFLTWVDRDRPDPSSRVVFAGGWAGQHLLVVPRSRAVVVTTGDPEFEFGPPPRDALPDDWRPLLHLLREHLLPLL